MIGHTRAQLLAISTLAALLAALLSAAGCSRSKKSGELALDKLYELGGVGDIRLEIDEEGLASLADKPGKFVAARFQFGGERLDQVGVRLKGHRSMREIGDKAAFKIRMDKFVDGQRFRGVRDLTLNNMVEDPTMIREYLGYRLYRAAGVHAPRVGYVTVTLNGEPYGLYALVESVDEAFLADRFADTSGNLYEGEYGCDLFPADVEGFDRDHGSGQRGDLAALAEITQRGSAAELFYDPGHPVHLKSFLGYLAVSAFIADFDGYRHAHNYRIYRPPGDGQWYFLPWGIDRAFKKDMDIYDSEGLLAVICFSDARCRLDYLRTLLDVTGEFERLDFESGVAVIQTITKDAVLADPKRGPSIEEVIEARKKLLAFIKERPVSVRKQASCLTSGSEVDGDGDGHGCMDCNDSDPNIHPGAAEACDQVDNDCDGLVDNDPLCSCPEVRVGEAIYYLCDLPMPWHLARDHCRRIGGHLARIDDEETNKVLYDAARNQHEDRWWIGLNDQAEEGTMVWDDGQPLAFERFSKGEPDNDACNQDCVALRDGGKGKWQDTHCGQHRPFICRARP